jgi:hypothetical protein
VACDLQRLSGAPAEYVLEVYAPRPLGEGELAGFAHAFMAHLGDYALATRVLRRLAWPMLVWGTLETMLLAVMQLRSLGFGPVGWPDLWVNLLIFGSGPIILAHLLARARRLRRSRRLAAAVLNVRVRVGGTGTALMGDPAHMRLVLDLWQFFWQVHGRDAVVLEQLQTQARRLGWRTAERFYATHLQVQAGMPADVVATGGRPPDSWGAAAWRFIFGPPLPAPLIAAPMPGVRPPAATRSEGEPP